MLKSYPVPGKLKSYEICKAFIDGAPADARGSVFYGVTEANDDQWRKAKLENEYWYCDNSYFDQTRQRYFRATHNAMQHSGRGTSDGKRFKALGIGIKKWRRSGEHIVLCPQSAHFMRLSGYYGDWIADTMVALCKVTDRPVRMRLWQPDKMELAATLQDDLRGAHCLITWSSAAAVTAILSGVPAICLGPCAAGHMAGASVEDVENLPMPDREEWAGVLADNQWTLQEMRKGIAWKMLNGDE